MTGATLNAVNIRMRGDAPMTMLQATSAVRTQADWTTAIARLFRRYLEHRRQRRALAQLQSVDPRILRDMGIDRTEVTSIVCGDPEGRRRRCTENLAAPYEGRRWCDSTERALIGDIANGRRSGP
jgi:uncharacterized protein YjiS (DUF1127 family)